MNTAIIFKHSHPVVPLQKTIQVHIMSQPVITRYTGPILIDQACERLTGEKAQEKQKPQMMGFNHSKNWPSYCRFETLGFYKAVFFPNIIYLHSYLICLGCVELLRLYGEIPIFNQLVLSPRV